MTLFLIALLIVFGIGGLNNRIYLGEIIDGITQNERLAGKRIRVAGTRPLVHAQGRIAPHHH